MFIVSITDADHQLARENFLKVERFEIVEPWVRRTPDHLKLFPLVQNV
jgi:hypothetical protein